MNSVLSRTIVSTDSLRWSKSCRRSRVSGFRWPPCVLQGETDVMINRKLTLRSLTATAVTLPMKRPLGKSVKSIENACLLLVDLLTQDGIEGRAYAFCYLPSIARSLVPIVAELSNALTGLPLAPLDLAHRVSRHFRLPGVTGPLAMVSSSVATAAWDALAKSAGLPLAIYRGADLHRVPAYNSNDLEQVAAEASDSVMLGVGGVGGVTGWQRGAGLAAAYNREVSSHLFPEVSAHLLAATPGRHWLEYADWADSILQEPIQIRDGMAVIPSRAGNGLSWNNDVVAKYRLDHPMGNAHSPSRLHTFADRQWHVYQRRSPATYFSEACVPL